MNDQKEYVISGKSFKEIVSCFFMTKWLSKLAGLIEGCKIRLLSSRPTHVEHDFNAIRV